MALIDDRKTVSAAGTAEQLETRSIAIRSVTITAESDNTGVVAVGGPDVLAAPGSQRGVILSAGAGVSWTAALDGVDDLRGIWLDAEVPGDGVSFSYGRA